MSARSWMGRLDPRQMLSIPAVYKFHSGFVSPDRHKQSYVDEILKVQSGSRLLDIGCGTADIVRYLPDVDYVGFDGDAEYIESARETFGDRGRFEHRIISADVARDFPPFDQAIATGILHHLTDDETRDLFSAAVQALKPGGRLVTCDGTYTTPQNPAARFLISLDRGQHVRTPDAYEALARSVFGSVDVEIRTDLIRIPYTHCVMTCTRSASEA